MFYKILQTPCQNTSIDTDLGRCRIIELPLFAPGKDHSIVLTKRDKAFTIFPNHLLHALSPTISVPSKPKSEHQEILNRRERMGPHQLPS